MLFRFNEHFFLGGYKPRQPQKVYSLWASIAGSLPVLPSQFGLLAIGSERSGVRCWSEGPPGWHSTSTTLPTRTRKVTRLLWEYKHRGSLFVNDVVSLLCAKDVFLLTAASIGARCGYCPRPSKSSLNFDAVSGMDTQVSEG